ncbi:MAG: dolichyl-P-Man:Man(7)GlcNAc(2)-PP-dolichol alpha-1,6-mannosyltransferase [Thelocarpon superellum]|nr:MAG: dolichyl-P-Man:Man(7)GlcNAc(2)-PP-dolichol alpha-1,6-mannosyltransferase [Thelocarpon superellum]
MKLFPDVLLALSLPGLVLLYLYLAPYSKVEESFNLQATHDILTYGVPTDDERELFLKAKYDHFTFPGAVPRTFVGALILAAFSKPGIWLGLDRQLVVRGVLGLLNSFALVAYGRSVTKAFGLGTGRWYLALQVCQFHVTYYASRTLPNMYAFGICTLALAGLLPAPPSSTKSAIRQRRLSLYLMTLAGVIFRSEIAILLAAQVGYLFVRRRMSLLGEVIPAGLSGALIGLLITVPIDSFFWQKFPLWPELAGLYFNVVEGKSTEWGTSPWWFYFLDALPRLLLNPLSWALCIPLALATPATRRPSADILVPLLVFIGIYSIQPHKEWRFIIYAVPGLTSVAAMGANWIWTRRAKSLLYAALSLMLVASVIASCGASLGMLFISRLNYPGAEALTQLHKLIPTLPPPSRPNPPQHSQPIIRIHMDGLTCSTGVTRFLEMPPPSDLLRENNDPLSSDPPPSSLMSSSFTNETRTTLYIYDKTEDEATLLTPSFWHQFDYVLAEDPGKVIGRWNVVREVMGYAGVELSREKTSAADTQDKGATEGPGGIETAYEPLAALVRTHLTRGWWLRVKMEPRLRILRRAEDEGDDGGSSG